MLYGDHKIYEHLNFLSKNEGTMSTNESNALTIFQYNEAQAVGKDTAE